MAGLLFIVNVPKKEYENDLKKNNLKPNLIFEQEKYERASKVIHELKEKHLGSKAIESYKLEDDSAVITKCRSTELLHQNKGTETYKCQSESYLTDGRAGDKRSYVRASWDEIKQVIKPRRNKLTITRPVRGVDILAAFHLDTPLETILMEIVERLDIKNAAWNSTRDDKFWQVIFSLETGNLSEELLQVLRTFGIGSRHQSSVSLLPCALYYKSSEEYSSAASDVGATTGNDDCSVSQTAWSRFSSSVRSRTNLAKVLHDVRAEAALTFDWLFMLLVAAFVAAIGLIENSTVILVASMLISPLMSPITAGTLGTAVQDRSLQLLGVKNEFVGLFLSLVMGFFFGLTICAIDEGYGVVEAWPTYEMISRCEYRSLWVGILVAIPSGAGVALAVLGDYTASLVGVAISASLLPPAVNAGLLWAMALTRLVVRSEELRWLVVKPSELAALGTASLCLTLVNIICIFLAGIAVYKVKEVSSLDRKDISWWRSNRSRFESGQPNNKKNMNWDAYSSWIENKMESKEASPDRETPNKNPSGQVQTETITYRRRPSQIKRLRAKNIEAYCRKAQLGEIYIQLDLESNGSTQTDGKSTESSTPDLDTSSQDTSKESHLSESFLEDLKTHNYYNLGFRDEKPMVHEAATIEPSKNLTLDPKQYGLVLGNKRYNV